MFRASDEAWDKKHSDSKFHLTLTEFLCSEKWNFQIFGAETVCGAFTPICFPPMRSKDLARTQNLKLVNYKLFILFTREDSFYFVM